MAKHCRQSKPGCPSSAELGGEVGPLFSHAWGQKNQRGLRGGTVTKRGGKTVGLRAFVNKGKGGHPD